MTYFKDFGIDSPLTAFGELQTASPDPAVQVLFPYAVNAEQATTAASGAAAAATWAGGLVSLASGTANNGFATLTTKRFLRYGAGQGGVVRFACIFGTGTANNTQIMGLGGTADGFFFGYNGTSFGVLRRSGGSDTWVAQTSWNIDKFNGTGGSGVTLDPTKGNVYQITYQWLGFGAITFWIENPNTGAFIPVHRIQYANENTATSIANPTLPIFMSSRNGASGTTSVTLQSGSMAAFTQGDPDQAPAVQFATGNLKSAVTTETNILTLSNKGTNVLGGTNTNRTPVQILAVSLAGEGNDPVVLRAVENTTLGGSPSLADHSANTSVIQKDTAGTTLTGGTERFSVALGKSGNEYMDVQDKRIYLYPGNTLTFAGSSATNAKIAVRVTWRELF
jgi:hypothetical protein